MSKKPYIVVQDNNDSKNNDFFIIKESSYKKLNKKNNIINIFIYDFEENKIYGYYEIDILNDVLKKENELIYISINNKNKRRRGIYYKTENKYSKYSILEIENEEFNKLDRKLKIINTTISQTFLKCSIENECIKYNAIETYPFLYVSEYSKTFSMQAYDSIYKEYLRLLKNSNSENNNIDKYLELGSYLMNMLFSEKDFVEHLLKDFRIVYLYLDNITKTIPWNILAYNNKFISEKILFSYTNTINTNNKMPHINNHHTKMAIISIPDEYIQKDDEEIEILKEIKEIDLYKKELNYLEFIKILESYDIVHIITHGYDNGIKLANDYIINGISKLENPPYLVFINSCNNEELDNKLVESLLNAGINTVISGIGSIADGYYKQFIEFFYQYLLHKNTRINTAQAYYFASIQVQNLYNCFIRYRFNGVASYV